MNYDDIVGLSNEMKAKFKAASPDNMAQAARIDGITPSALMLVLAETRRLDQKKKAS